MNIAKPADLYGLVGYPVEHSFSPGMHNAGFLALDINAEYKLFPVKPESLHDFFSSLRGKGIKGLNVTVPYKEKVLEFMDDLSFEAEFCGAVNVVSVEDKRIKGGNTDGLGFHKHLTKELGFHIEGSKVVLLGAGGAAKAVVEQLASKKSAFIQIFDIDQEKSLALSDKVNQKYSRMGKCRAESIQKIADLDIKQSDLIINATPVGLKPGDPCLVDPDSFCQNQLVYDLIYNPSQTEFLKAAAWKGARTSNGLGMLFYQGWLSFSRWLKHIPGHSNDRVPEKEMWQALLKQIKK